MEYTVRKLAALSGITVRTLHHYDEIGLLKPARVGSNGYRYYGEKELLRLQQLLFFRELGMPLAQIRAALDDDAFDQVRALRNHRAALSERLEHTHALIETIDRTIQRIEGAGTMADKELFKGFDAKRQAQYEEELVRDWNVSREQIARTNERVKAWDDNEWTDVRSAYDRLHRAFTAQLTAGEKPSSQAVQAIVAEHYRVIERFYTPSAQMYAGLGRMYVEHADFRSMYDQYHPGLAEFMAAAMKVYAERNLEGSARDA